MSLPCFADIFFVPKKRFSIAKLLRIYYVRRLVVVVVCFLQRPSKYIKTTHITTYGQKKNGHSDRMLTVKACNIQPYNEFKN